MGQVITEEIDLRPTWRRWTNTHPSPGRLDVRPAARAPLPRTSSELGARPAARPAARAPLPRTSSELGALPPTAKVERPTTLLLAGGGLALAFAFVALGGSSSEPSAPKGPRRAGPVAAASIAGDASRERRTAADALADAHPIHDRDPIIIYATEERSAPEPRATAPEKRPAHAAPEHDGKGKLQLTSDPEVTVFEGSRKLGTTPLTVRLAAGPHDLRFVNRGLHLEEKRRVDVRAGKTEERELAFALGTLRVIAPEGAKLLLNGHAVGEAPFAKLRLAEGRHHVKLELDGHALDEWIEVPSGHQVEYRARFDD